MTVWIMEAAEESSSLEQALSSLLNQVSVGISKTKSVSATKMQPRMNEKKFTNHFLGDVFLPFTHKPWNHSWSIAPSCPQSRWALPSTGHRKNQYITWSPPQDSTSQEWLPTSIWWVGDLLSNGLIEEGPGWPRSLDCWVIDWFLDIRFNGGSYEQARQSATWRGFRLGKMHCGTQTPGMHSALAKAPRCWSCPVSSCG